MNIEYLIQALTSYFMKYRMLSEYAMSFNHASEEAERFTLEGYTFAVIEHEFSSPFNLMPQRRISIIPEQAGISILSVTYDCDLTSTRANEINRRQACRTLARDLLINIMPKLSAKIRTAVHNLEVDEILSALD